MIWKGLRFGMILQLAVGPVCLLVINTAVSYGMFSAMQVVLGVALTDAVFIALSGAGAAILLRKNAVKKTVRVVGCAVLVLFGMDSILGALNLPLLPDVALFAASSSCGFFWRGLLLTASNPLTIVFWSGMFAAEAAKNNRSERQMIWFAVGCVLATLLFLSTVGALGSFVGAYLPDAVIQILNIVAGLVLMFCGFKFLYHQEKTFV